MTNPVEVTYAQIGESKSINNFEYIDFFAVFLDIVEELIVWREYV